jgi:NADH:ubiquinone oxidoreductase subunit B-like Fe-S oxidoreductase
MTARELDEAIFELRYAAARQSWVVKRAIRTFFRTRSLTTALFVLGMNRGWKRMAKSQVPVDAQRYGLVPQPSARMQRVLDSFRMHFWSPASAVP